MKGIICVLAESADYMLEYISLISEKPLWLRRFWRAVTLMCLAVPSTFLPITYAGWSSFFLYLLAIGAAAEQVFYLPHEGKRLTRIDRNIKNLEICEAKRYINSYNYLESVPFCIQKIFYKSQCYMQEGDLKNAYNEIIKTRSYYLLPKEKSVQIEIICLILWNAGNFRDYKIQVDKKEYNAIKDYSPATYALLNSFYYEISDDISQAKSVLENGLIESLDDEETLAIYNNLARIDLLLGNKQERVSHLRKASDVLKKADIPKYYRIVYHNLSIALLGEGRYSEAKAIMEIYYQSINPNNIRQCLNFSNDNIAFARELNDQSAIDEAHALSGRLIDESKLETLAQKVSLRVSELRMLRNDRQKLDNYAEHAEELISSIERLSGSERILYTIALLKDMRFEVESINTKKEIDSNDAYLLRLFRNECSRLFNQLNIIDDEIQSISPVLLEPRIEWKRNKHFILKVYIYHFNVYKKDYFCQMFNNLIEISNVSKEKENRYAEVNALLIICDEFIAYSDMLPTSKFHSDFFSYAFDAYSRASNVLNNSIQRPEFQDQMVGMAYFSLRLGFGKQIAYYWLDCAQQFTLKLSHYAIWFRSYYDFINRSLQSS